MTMRPVRRGVVLTSAVIAGLLLSVVSAPLTASATPTAGPNDANITYVGRWDRSSSSEYVSYWGGAYFKVDFSGPTVALELGSAADIYVSIDGGPDVFYDNATGIVNLTPTSLGAGYHSLRVASRYMDDQIHFRGLDLASGQSTAAPAVSDKSIEFIGDSITAGINNTKQALSDYAWLTGEQLHAEHTQIAYSGICLTNIACFPPNTTGMSTQFLKREPITGAHQTDWNFATQPTAVVINLGTNDYLFPSTPTDATAFQATYVAFLQSVRSKYPGAEIFALRTLNGYYATQTAAAVSTVAGQGDAHVHFVDTTGWVAASDFAGADTVHPIDTGHEKIASRLAKVLAPYLYPQNVSSTAPAPVLEDFRNTSDWVPGNDANANIYTTGTSAAVSCICSGGLSYGSVAKTVAYNVDSNPFLSIRVDSVSNAEGNVAAGQWGLKVNDGAGADIQLQGVTSQTGLLTYDLKAVTGWSGSKTFAIKLFVLNNSIDVSTLTNHSPQVARGAPVTASSTVNGNVPSAAVDGDRVSRWESGPGDSQWITVDLGAPTTVDSAIIRWEAAYAKAFTIDVSLNNSSWTTIYTTSNATGGDPVIWFAAPTTARYVRITMTQRGSIYAYSLYEFELYRHDLATGAAVEASSTLNNNLPQYLTDVNYSTRWESQASDPQGVIVDLGSTQAVGRLMLKWETASAKNFEVYVSTDHAAWTKVYQTTSGSGGDAPVTFTPITARYVFVYMTQRVHPEYAYSLYGLEAYNS